METKGSIATSVVRPGSRGVVVDRKAILMVQDLKRFMMNITGISETKWFGQAVYNVEGYTILHSGRPIPTETLEVKRGEGVGIVLDTHMTMAWRDAGETWRAVSSRVLTARLKIAGQDVSRSDRPSSRSRPFFMSIISVFAPTHRSAQEKKDEFYAHLQETIDSVHVDDVLLVVGDFNARVGSSERRENSSMWDGVRGCHGAGKMNESGEALLSFCALNELTIMNTCFEKKNINKYTWQHPGSKKWHCIDYVIMRRKQRRFCCNVTVL